MSLSGAFILGWFVAGADQTDKIHPAVVYAGDCVVRSRKAGSLCIRRKLLTNLRKVRQLVKRSLLQGEIRDRVLSRVRSWGIHSQKKTRSLSEFVLTRQKLVTGGLTRSLCTPYQNMVAYR